MSSLWKQENIIALNRLSSVGVPPNGVLYVYADSASGELASKDDTGSIHLLGPSSGTVVTTPFFGSEMNSNATITDTFTTLGSIAVYPFNLPYAMLVTNIILFLGGGSGVPHLDVGIYDTLGNLLGSSGIVSTSVNLPTTFPLVSPTTLPAGTYLLAITEPLTDSPSIMGWGTNSPNGIIFYYSATTLGTPSLPSSISVAAVASNTPQAGVMSGGIPIFILS